MNRKVIISLAILIISVMACSIPSAKTLTPVVITQVVVATRELVDEIQPSPTLPLPTISLITVTPLPTGEPVNTETIPASATATLNGPILTFIKNANCRRGPSTQEMVVTSFFAGDNVKIVGRNPDFNNTWWIVETPDGGKCWVSLTTGQAYGDFDDIPTVIP